MFVPKREPLPEIKEVNKVPEELREPVYEPKRKFRWILAIEGLPCHFVKRCDGFLFPGGSTLKVQYYEAVNNPVSEELLRWNETKETRPASLKFLGPVGEVLQEWVFKDFRLNVSSFDDLDYSKSDPVSVSCSFIYASVALKVSFEQ